MQITPLVPISGQGGVAPADPNAQLYEVLTKLLANNKPTSSMDGSSPDQQAASKATTKTEESGKKGPVIPGKTTDGNTQDKGVLPNIIEQLFGNTDPQSQDPTKGDSKTAPASYEGGLTSLIHQIRGKGGDSAGKKNPQGIMQAAKTIMSLFA